MNDQAQIVFISKYALTRGILRKQAVDIIGGKIASIKLSGESENCEYLSENDWHLTRDAAISRAKKMRDAKIACLERQIGRLKDLSF